MRLVILNGPAGVGKSTIATRLNGDLPDSVVVEIDAIRRALPEWRERREESLKEAHILALETIRKELAAGRDVIVDKFIVGTNTLDSIIGEGERSGAVVREIILTADKDIVTSRANVRGFHPGGLLTLERVEELWERLQAFIQIRPQATVIDTTNLNPEEVYQKVSESL